MRTKAGPAKVCAKRHEGRSDIDLAVLCVEPSSPVMAAMLSLLCVSVLFEMCACTFGVQFSSVRSSLRGREAGTLPLSYKFRIRKFGRKLKVRDAVLRFTRPGRQPPALGVPLSPPQCLSLGGTPCTSRSTQVSMAGAGWQPLPGSGCGRGYQSHLGGYFLPAGAEPLRHVPRHTTRPVRLETDRVRRVLRGRVTDETHQTIMLMCGGGGGEEVDPEKKKANDEVRLAAPRRAALPARPRLPLGRRASARTVSTRRPCCRRPTRS